MKEQENKIQDKQKKIYVYRQQDGGDQKRGGWGQKKTSKDSQH